VLLIGFQHASQVRRDDVAENGARNSETVPEHDRYSYRIEDAGCCQSHTGVLPIGHQYRSERNPIKTGKTVHRIVAHAEYPKFLIRSYRNGVSKASNNTHPPCPAPGRILTGRTMTGWTMRVEPEIRADVLAIQLSDQSRPAIK
jgi:hypothetical protein